MATQGNQGNQGNRGFSQQHESQRGQERGGQDRGGQDRGREQGRSQQGTAGGVMESVRENAGEWVSSAGNKIGDAWDTARQGVQQFGSNLPDNASEALDTVSGFISRNPIPSLLCAVAVGFLIGRTMHSD
jgi:ElaB/YqjD/DUF883 family membrane-anchored ribosome-binding protein